ncbi:MAG: alpha-amylase family protein [Paenibacillaceae bacterium]
MQRAKGKGKDNVDKWWISRPLRQIQTNLREIDMLDIDAQQVVADLQAFKATSLLLNTSGIIASYPTKLPFHYQSLFLKGDSLSDIIAACHEADIAVIARTDFSKVRRPIYEQHPEWAYVSPEGKIVDYNGDVHVCVNGDYQQKYALEIIKETLTTLDLDGIMFNAGGFQFRDYSDNYYGICHCMNCKRKFSEQFGLTLPKAEDMNDPIFRKYEIFKKRVTQAHGKMVYDLVQSIRPNLLISGSKLQRSVLRQESYTEIHYALPHWQYSASDNTKFAVSSYSPMISANSSTEFIGIHYRHVAVSPHQQALRLAQNLANGGGLDYYIMGRLDNHKDKSGFESVKKMFHYHAQQESDYMNLSSNATIAVLTGPHADRDRIRDVNREEFRGWFRFLVEDHFLFDTLMMDAALELPWTKYKAVIVPDYQRISDDLAKKLNDYAFAGGIVISTSRTAFRGDNYDLRDAPVLKCLGVEQFHYVRSDMTSSYFNLDHKEEFGRFVQADLIYMDGNYVYAEYNENVEKYFSLIPPHHYGPPERAYYSNVTDYPGFTVHPFGKGKGIYIPWEPGALYHRQGHTNTIDFIADLLEGVAGLERVGGNLSQMVEVTLFEQKEKQFQLLHLVNGTGHFGVTYFAPVTLSDMEVSIPCTHEPSAVRGLVTGKDYSFKVQDGALTIQIPKLELFEAIKIVNGQLYN